MFQKIFKGDKITKIIIAICLAISFVFLNSYLVPKYNLDGFMLVIAIIGFGLLYYALFELSVMLFYFLINNKFNYMETSNVFRVIFILVNIVTFVLVKLFISLDILANVMPLLITIVLQIVGAFMGLLVLKKVLKYEIEKEQVFWFGTFLAIYEITLVLLWRIL